MCFIGRLTVVLSDVAPNCNECSPKWRFPQVIVLALFKFSLLFWTEGLGADSVVVMAFTAACATKAHP